MEKLHSKVPKFRFPEFTDTWEHRKLSDLLIESKKRNEDLKFGKDGVLSVSGEMGVVNQIDHLGRSYAGISVHQYHIVETGDIVYTKSPLKANPFGIIKLNKGKPGIVSTLYAVYSVNEKNAYGPFLDHYFSLDANTNRYLRPLVKKGAKNDMKINNAYVLHDRVFTPTIFEQQKISSFFTEIDNRLSVLKKKKALLLLYKKGVIQKILSQEIRLKDEEGNEFPKWSNTKLGEIYSFRNTNSFSRDQLNYHEGNIKNIHYGDIHTKYKPLFDITKEHVPFVNPSIIIKRINEEDYCREGDLVIADASEDYSDIGKCIEIINLDNKKTIAGLHTLLARPDTSKMSLGFGNYLMKYDKVRMQIKVIAQGTKVLSLSSARLSKLQINIPCIDEQVKIVRFLSSLDERIDKCGMQIEQTTLYKKGLLQKMFC